MEKIRSLLAEIQNKIESSNFVIGLLSQMSDLPKVDMHLGFTTNEGILNMLKHLSMLDKDHLLQAKDIVEKESNPVGLRPFLYITYFK